MNQRTNSDAGGAVRPRLQRSPGCGTPCRRAVASEFGTSPRRYSRSQSSRYVYEAISGRIANPPHVP